MINTSQILAQAMNNQKLLNNPRAQKVLEAYRNHDHEALVEIGNNIFKENGTTLEDAAKNFMRMNRIN